MNYEAALAYLEERNPFGSRLGLTRMQALLEALGHPERGLRYLHLAGTNGKGSTAVMTAALLAGLGYRTGLYTSPHLVSFCERIALDGLPVAEERVGRLMERLIPAVAEVEAKLGAEERITKFEVTTALAFLVFQEEKPDFVVLETGLGGRLDATNVVIPCLSVITAIGYDHTERLGRQLEEIAREKAGIIKPGVPVVIGPQPHQAAREFLAAAAAGVPVTWVAAGGTTGPAPEVSFGLLGNSLAGVKGYLQLGPRVISPLRLSLLGRHQLANAATAAAAVYTLYQQGELGEVDEEALVAVAPRALNEVFWPGRLEVIRREPPLLLDGAHNPSGMRELVGNLQDFFPERPLRILFGVLKDKDYRAMLAALAPLAPKLILTRPPHSYRAEEPEKVAVCCQELGIGVEDVIPDVERAWREALVRSGREGVALCVCGSLYLVGAVRAMLAEVGDMSLHPLRYYGCNLQSGGGFRLG